uniref:UMOD/GP2/OIT3-like D8C domain-containing protein n=1 Tax=Pygocentrus nattereri TaxID=42514 RepID=A0A3B4EIN6_PYGNA
IISNSFFSLSLASTGPINSTFDPSFDPCNNYTDLDHPWRASNETGLGVCDRRFPWNGWYRVLYYGKSIRMAESCVPTSRCSTYVTLWLNGPHPEIEDGVVTRQVCGSANSDCCYYRSTPIQVKACPDNYYVYKFVHPINCNLAYCSGTLIHCTHFISSRHLSYCHS